MTFLRSSLVAFALSLSLAYPGSAQAQSTEERFQDLFVTAGYCTAFGAAIGTAFLAWTTDPSENLRYVAIGASLGFLGGSVLGSYVIFSPMVADNETPAEGTLLAAAPLPEKGLVLRPTWNKDTHSVKSIEGGMTLLTF